VLNRTFVHLPGVGLHTEARFWRLGLATWEDFLAAPTVVGVGAERLAWFKAQLAESREHLGHLRYFASRLPGSEHWRLFRQFKGRAAYLDIETSGATWPHLEVTVVGLYDGATLRQFVKGRNLADFPEAFANVQVLVTFNGTQFDLPVLLASFPDLAAPPVHLDLRFLLARLGFKGGLKKIEPRFGLKRPPGVAGLNGFDAVLLWDRYQRGDRTALDRLLEYNKEDVVNLEILMDEAFRRHREQVLRNSL
jgi:uncharacterized protein YprB with RNaseH-like and TPR domain